MRRLSVLLLGLACVASVSATVLWDQSQLADYVAQMPIVTSQEFPPPDPFGTSSSYTMNDIATDGQNWVIQEVTVYYSRYSTPSPWQGVVQQARLNAVNDVAGIDQNLPVIGATAMDLLAIQLYHNEHGLPQGPVLSMVEGRWVDGKTAPRRKVRRRHQSAGRAPGATVIAPW